jgi:hypothetical protein
MGHNTRRITGFGINADVVNGETLCRMFKQAIRGVTTFPRCLSSNHDPLYRFHQWEANLRVRGISEIKTVPDAFAAKCLAVYCFAQQRIWRQGWTNTDAIRMSTASRIEWAATEFQPKGAHKPGFISLAETLSRGLYQTPAAA